MAFAVMTWIYVIAFSYADSTPLQLFISFTFSILKYIMKWFLYNK